VQSSWHDQVRGKEKVRRSKGHRLGGKEKRAPQIEEKGERGVSELCEPAQTKKKLDRRCNKREKGRKKTGSKGEKLGEK